MEEVKQSQPVTDSEREAFADEILSLQNCIERKHQQIEAFKANSEKAYKRIAEMEAQINSMQLKITKALEFINQSAEVHEKSIKLILKGDI